MNVSRVSVLICTYNRAPLLQRTLAALAALTPPDECDVEIIVVDNNSTDATADLLRRHAENSPFRMRSAKEHVQGKSFALNRGLGLATGQVIALTDDDACPHAEWLRRIVECFRRHDVSFVFGKVLPRWSSPPPADLLLPAAQAIWGPLALLDFGDEPIRYTPEITSQRLGVGANLAFSRAALQTVGGWRTDLGKVNNSLIAGEDHEMFCRFRRFGLFSGYYDPAIIVEHHVPADRLTRSYFRKWFYWLGKTFALMLDDLYPTVDLPHARRFAGTPRFLWKDSLQQLGRYLRMLRPGTPRLEAFIEELKLFQCCGLVVEGWKRRRQKRASSRLVVMDARKPSRAH